MLSVPILKIPRILSGQPQPFVKSAAMTIDFLGDRPQIVVHKDVFEKMLAMPHSKQFADGTEGSAYCTVIRDGLTFFIDQFFVFEQIAESAETRMSQTDIGEFAFEMIKAGKTSDLNRLRLWYHFHPHGTTSPSGSYIESDYGDLSQMKDFGRAADYFIMAIATPQGDIRFDLFLYQPFEIRMSNVDFIVYDPNYENVLDSLEKSLKGKVKKVQRIQTIPASSQHFAPGQVSTKRRKKTRRKT